MPLLALPLLVVMHALPLLQSVRRNVLQPQQLLVEVVVGHRKDDGVAKLIEVGHENSIFLHDGDNRSNHFHYVIDRNDLSEAVVVENVVVGRMDDDKLVVVHQGDDDVDFRDGGDELPIDVVLHDDEPLVVAYELEAVVEVEVKHHCLLHWEGIYQW